MGMQKLWLENTRSTEKYRWPRARLIGQMTSNVMMVRGEQGVIVVRNEAMKHVQNEESLANIDVTRFPEAHWPRAGV